MRATPRPGTVVYSDRWSAARRLAVLAALRFPFRRPALNALHPEAANPVLTYALDTAAADYAHTHLIPDGPPGLRRAIRRVLTSVLACDPSVAALVITQHRGVPLAIAARVDQMVAPSRRRLLGSALSIHSTRSVRLLFGHDPTRPEFVVRSGNRHVMEREFEIRQRLHELDPALIPEPIACGPWLGDEWAAIDAGVAGLPWFRTAAELRTRHRQRLLHRLLAALRRLHLAIQRRPEWRRSVSVGDALSRELAACRSLDVALPDSVAACVAAVADRAVHAPPVPWFAQHGDFCPNNVIVAPDRMTVIDFEEFDDTAVPLHDELTLAFSVDSFMGEGTGGAAFREESTERRRSETRRLLELVAACIGPTVDRAPELKPLVPALVVHHLLWRLTRSATRPGREALGASIRERLRRFASDPALLAMRG